MTHRRAKGERSRRRLRSREAPRRSRSREASIAISRSTASIAITRSIDRNLANRRSQSSEAPCWSQPLVEPSRLSLFLLLSIWPDLIIFFFFFLGFVCVSVLRNEWYYIFIWQPRKCDQIWWFFFWVLFVFLYWGMNDIIYLFGNQENVSNK